MPVHVCVALLVTAIIAPANCAPAKDAAQDEWVEVKNANNAPPIYTGKTSSQLPPIYTGQPNKYTEKAKKPDPSLYQSDPGLYAAKMEAFKESAAAYNHVKYPAQKADPAKYLQDPAKHPAGKKYEAKTKKVDKSSNAESTPKKVVQLPVKHEFIGRGRGINHFGGFFNRSDLASSYLRNKMAKATPVAAAQGTYDGPPVLSAIFGTNNFPGLTDFNLAVGMITLGNDGEGGCGVVPFHNHPNCYEFMTTISGYGAYGQVKPDGSTAWSPIMRAGDIYVMREGSQHFYRNLDPNGYWQFEISFTCSEVGSTSGWKWPLQLNKALAMQFWDISDGTAEAIINPIDPKTGMTYSYGEITKIKSIRYIPNCAAEAATWDTQLANDHELKFTGLFTRPSLVESVDGKSGLKLASGSYKGPETNKVSTYNMTSSFPAISGFGFSVGYITLEPKGMMLPITVHNAHTIYHVLAPEGTEPFHLDGARVMVAQFTYNSKLIVDVLQVHDVVIVPAGSLHFIVNLLDGPGSCRILTHYDNDSPTMGVTTDFFPNLPTNIVEGIMQIPHDAAKEMSRYEPGRAMFKKPMFEKFKGELDELEYWARTREQYNVLYGDSKADSETNHADPYEEIKHVLAATALPAEFIAKFQAHEVNFADLKTLSKQDMMYMLGLSAGTATKIYNYLHPPNDDSVCLGDLCGAGAVAVIISMIVVAVGLTVLLHWLCCRDASKKAHQ